MLNTRWLAGLGIDRRQFLLVFVPLFNVFTWYYMTLMIIESIPLDVSLTSAFRTVFYLAAIGSGFAGSFLSDRVRRLNLLYFWMSMGIISSFLLASFEGATIARISIAFTLLGISFGLGIPSCLAYLADNTSVENRGRISALVFLFVNLSAFPLAIALGALDMSTYFIVLALWRGMGLVFFALLKPSEGASEKRNKSGTFMSVLHDRSFFLYFVPWLMFNIIDSLEKALLKDFFGSGFHRLIITLSPVIASFSILFAGLLSDRIGRKRVVVYGFVSLGVAYAIIGIAPMLQLAWSFYLVVDAIATGTLWITFILILWGDLSLNRLREKYYVVGSLPFLATAAIPLSLMPLSNVLEASTAFSIASFFLFLAVLPLMYAPETLPQKNIELRRVKGYIRQARKLTDKYKKET